MSVVANRYIQALFELPKSEEQNKTIEKALKEVAELFDSNNELKKVLLDPRIASNLKVEIIKEIFPQYKDNKIVMNFLTLLIEEERIDLISEIAEEYEKINLDLNKILNIKIITASKIDDGQVKKIVETFKNMYKVNTINYELEIDEELLGGVKVMVGNKVYDGSVSTQLKNMF